MTKAFSSFSMARCLPLRLWRALIALALLTLPMDIARAEDAEEDHTALAKRGAYREALTVLDRQIQPRLPNVPPSWLVQRAELRFLVGEVDLAIKDYEEVTEWSSEPAETLRLAELYRYRGRMEDFDRALKDAERRLRDAWNYATPQDALLVAGRIAELQGEDPKRILSSVYGTLMKRAPDFAPAFVAAGRLAYSKGSFGAAAQYYDQALALDSEDQEALAGLAACLWESRDERLEETLAKLEAINPHRPEGQAVRVEMLLDARKVSDALARIDDVLSTNPNQLHFRALKAAALFLTDDVAGMEALQQDTLAFNALCSDVYRVPGRVATRHYRFKEAEALQRKALEVNPTDHEARAELAVNLLRLGQDEAGKQELDAVFAADPYNVRVFNSLKVLDTLATFTTVSQGPFEIQLPPEEAPVLAPAVLAMLEEEFALLAKKYAVEVETPIRVQIFDRHDDFMVRSLGLPGNAGHLGICFGQLVTMDSPSARPKGSVDWHAVLWHEFAHVITLQKTHNRMPRWLSEGISVHEETLRNPGWGTRLAPNHAALIGDKALPGASELELYFTQPETPAHLMLGYFLAGEFVAHYTATYGDTALVEALDRIGQRDDALQALATAAKVSLEALDDTFRDHLGKRFAVLSSIPALANAMRRGTEALEAEAWAEAEAAFLEARDVFPELGGGDGSLARLAELYEAMGRIDKLEEALRARLSLSTVSLTSWQRLAALYEEAGNWEGVLFATSGGAAVDPFDVDLGRSLFEAQQALAASEDALVTAERLIALDAPRATEYRLARARLLMELEHWTEARRQVVLLLEELPHYREAQELLLDLAARNQS